MLDTLYIVHGAGGSGTSAGTGACVVDDTNVDAVDVRTTKAVHGDDVNVRTHEHVKIAVESAVAGCRATSYSKHRPSNVKQNVS